MASASTGSQTSSGLLDLFDRAAVILFCPIQKGDQWSRIKDGATHCGRSP